MRNCSYILKMIFLPLKKYYKDSSLAYFVTNQLCLFLFEKNFVFLNKKELVKSKNFHVLKDILYQITKLDIPYQYVLGQTDFCDVKIFLKSPVFIPRNETESFVMYIREKLSFYKDKISLIADFCSGTGCVGIAMIKFFLRARCDAFEINHEAVKLSSYNASYNSLSKRYRVIHKDISLLKKYKKYDIVIGNPPYISMDDYRLLPTSVMRWEDKKALTDESTGYKIILKLLEKSKKMVFKSSIIAFEICESYSKFILKKAQEIYPKDYVFLWQDQNLKNRVIIIAKGNFISLFKNGCS